LDHLDLVTKLADELNAVQQSVRSDSGDTKQLSIVVRYASEMNDRPNTEAPEATKNWGHKPEAFRETFQTVRDIFTAHAPGLLFAFSPAIRADLDPAVNNPGHREHFRLSNYWPGDDLVDYVSCTWYVDGQNNFQPATNYLRSYFQEFQPQIPRLGIDEIGGFVNGSNQAMLEAMIDEIERLNATVPGMFFNYLTFFLEGQYGIDADLTGFA
jgi:beta-mannanase